MSSPSQRLLPLDWMRGFVMVLMTIDHASMTFNRERLSQDSYGMHASGASLFVHGSDPTDFLTRWITHLCAPTFVFLAGAALALSIESRVRRGESSWAVDRHMLARGLLLILLELWMSLASMFAVLQVLYAIGASLIAMVLLRRLPSWLLVALALGWIGAGEWVVEALDMKPELFAGRPPIVDAPTGLLFVSGLSFLPFTIPAFGWMPQMQLYFALYPMLPWLAVMMLGWVFGRWLVQRRDDPGLGSVVSKRLAAIGLLSLGVFVVQRVFDGYGNYWLPRGDDTAWRWLQVSKYPPSLAFLSLELGLMALLLAGLFRLRSKSSSLNSPLLVFGQVALFFYLVHIHLMALVRAAVFGFSEPAPYRVGGAWLIAGIALVALYPLCRLYRNLKQSRPKGLLRYF